jgi:hypothetical protein
METRFGNGIGGDNLEYPVLVIPNSELPEPYDLHDYFELGQKEWVIIDAEGYVYPYDPEANEILSVGYIDRFDPIFDLPNIISFLLGR